VGWSSLTSRVLAVEDVIQADRMATKISEDWITKDNMRQVWKTDTEEVRRYVFATDTSHTSAGSIPWKNKTTIPKLCQIRDNLIANYLATMFPKMNNVVWEANELNSQSKKKRDSITSRARWWMEQPFFKSEMTKIVSDYVDSGNCVATVDWLDSRAAQPAQMQSGYVGPVIRRINPFDIVVNPTAENFQVSPKIVRSVISLGELKELMQRMSEDGNREMYDELWKYIREIRGSAKTASGEWTQLDNLYSMDGFSSFQNYLQSDTVELLTFYGDMYDSEEDVLYKNYVITVVDRHKVVSKKPNPSFFSYPPIFHAGWRMRPDNIWAMGPLNNLVGMQYRMDHVENMKADIWDWATYPMIVVTGFVESFTMQPGEIIYASEEGKVDVIQPQVQILQANSENAYLSALMEEMAGAPKEAMGFRTPGEKTKYEVQRLENAASRIFQNKIKQFEEQILEPLLNAMLELDRRNLTGATTIKVFDDELKAATFRTLTVEDITGVGRIRPIAARHFAEQAELIQNLTALSQSQLWPTVSPHFSGVKLSKLFESSFDIEDKEIVIPFVALAEQAEGQRLAQALQESVMQSTGTASGMGDDFDQEQFAGAIQEEGF
jgi:hypothetical protein